MTKSSSEQWTVPPDRRSHEEQPRWRQDFPIDWPQDHYIFRREFIKFLLLTSGAFTAGQFWFLIQNFLRERQPAPPALAIASVDDVPVGGWLLFEYPEGSASRLLVRVDEETFVAYEQQCTHLLCPVIPQMEERQLYCPCHSGYFDMMSGRPTAGPPQRPLARVHLEIRDGVIYATAIEARTV